MLQIQEAKTPTYMATKLCSYVQDASHLYDKQSQVPTTYGRLCV